MQEQEPHMPEFSLSEAAALLGVTVDEVRRRISLGTVRARTASDGRYLVHVDDVPPHTGGQENILRLRSQAELSNELRAERDRLQAGLGQGQELIEELRRQRDELSLQLAAQREHLQATTQVLQQDAADRAELRRLLGGAHGQIAAFVIGSVELAAKGAGIKKRQRRRLIKRLTEQFGPQ
jgi:hypothetical protein